MPYTTCPNCRTTLYSAAAYSTVDRCPRCHTTLEPAARMAEVRALQRSFAARDGLTRRPGPDPAPGQPPT
jgi:tRNA(Ile2) C34 agmatinyltransferase TiaS